LSEQAFSRLSPAVLKRDGKWRHRQSAAAGPVVALVSYLRRLQDLADADPDRPAVTCGAESLSRAGLLRAIDQLALDLRAHGLREGDMLTIALPNSVDWFVAFGAAWRLGATPQPVSARLPRRELEAVIELADPPVILGLPENSVPGRVCLPATSRRRGPVSCPR
jgi:bile acid-coenzyme A ligase